MTMRIMRGIGSGMTLGALALLSSAPGVEAAPDGSETGRDLDHYSPSRPVDYRHMRLELRFTEQGFRDRTVEGRVVYDLAPRSRSVDALTLDAVDMTVLGVELPGEPGELDYSYDDERISIQLPRSYAPDEELQLAVDYRLQDPPKGVHFRLPTESSPDKPLMVYTMSEALEARYWVPSHDWPNERWTSDLLITVPDGFMAVANGELIETSPTDGDGVTYHWRNDVPTDPHLVGLAIGELEEIPATWKGRATNLYTLSGFEDPTRFTFRRVPEMLDFYSDLLSVEFPFPAYHHVTVVEHHHGAMEHAGFSMIDPYRMSTGPSGEAPIDWIERNYTAHMLAHQWFGGIVNYRSVSQAWLNEGFASYLDALWMEHSRSRDYFLCLMEQGLQRSTRFQSTTTGKPMVHWDLSEAFDTFSASGGQIYAKGGWVLHMLRQELGDDLFWQGVKDYLETNRWQGVETADFRRAMESVSGEDLEQFFAQWVFRPGMPRLEVDYRWDETTSEATIGVRQTQETTELVPAFDIPLELCFRTGGADTCETVRLYHSRHEFTFALTEAPTGFWVDPEGKLFAAVTVDVPRAQRIEQATNGPTALTRLRAVTALGEDGHPESTTTLGTVLGDEQEFWMVRAAAAEALGASQTPDALTTLLDHESRGISDPGALAAVYDALGQYPVSRDAHEVLLGTVDPRTDVRVEASMLLALGDMRASSDLIERSVDRLQTGARKPSRRWARMNALWAISALEEPDLFDTVWELAQPARGDELRDTAIRVLGSVGRGEEHGEQALDQLTVWLYDPDPSARIAAARGLGALGDAAAVPDLRRLAESNVHRELRDAAEYAIETIGQVEDAVTMRQTLVEQLSTMEKRNVELEEQLQRLEDRIATLEGHTIVTDAGAQ